MKRLVMVLLPVLVAMSVIWFITRPSTLTMADLPDHQVDPVNGKTLFYAGGCGSCHTSPDNDEDPPLLGGGLELETEFGTFTVPNISSHKVHGIGSWSTLDFVNAMHLGVSPDRRHYYPSFPYTSYQRMSFEDLMDLKSYMDSLPASDSEPAEHKLRFPWNLRHGIGLWKLVNLDSSFIISVENDNEELKRGRYLVEGPGHCGECHTPRDWTGGLATDRWLAGAENPDGEGRIPNISPSDNGLGDWSASDIEYYLSSGFTPDFDTVGGSMVEVQENMTHLTAEDRAAIAAYLKAIPSQD